jgi:hypothetical protein
MENKVIVLGSILAASAVTIALCVMGKKKDEVKSNACGCEENSNLSGRVDGGAGVGNQGKDWTKRKGK